MAQWVPRAPSHPPLPAFRRSNGTINLFLNMRLKIDWQCTVKDFLYSNPFFLIRIEDYVSWNTQDAIFWDDLFTRAIWTAKIYPSPPITWLSYFCRCFNKLKVPFSSFGRTWLLTLLNVVIFEIISRSDIKFLTGIVTQSKLFLAVRMLNLSRGQKWRLKIPRWRKLGGSVFFAL